MPENIGPPWRSFPIRLSRNSSFTRRSRSCASENGLWRNSPSVRGRLMIEKPPEETASGPIIRPAPMSSRVPIATGFAAYVHSPAHRRQDGFKEGNDGSQTFSLRFHPQQSLFEVEVKRKRSREVERELSGANLGGFLRLRARQRHN